MDVSEYIAAVVFYKYIDSGSCWIESLDYTSLRFNKQDRNFNENLKLKLKLNENYLK